MAAHTLRRLQAGAGEAGIGARGKPSGGGAITTYRISRKAGGRATA
jgi:hypothetical protein